MSPSQIKGMTIGEFVRSRAQTHGRDIALDYLTDGRRFTYKDIQDKSDQYAGALQTLGIGRATHVALMLENSPEFLLLLIAIAKIGAVAVPLTPSLRGSLLKHFIGHSDAEVLIVEEAPEEMLNSQILQDTALKSVLVVNGGVTTGAARGSIGIQTHDLGQLVRNATVFACEEVSYKDLAMLMYTSGTTGPSKANMFTQTHVLQYAFQQAQAYGYLEEDVVYTCLPISHANGLLSSTYGAFAAGARVALVRKFSVSRFWEEVRTSGSTVVGLLGSMTDFLWNAPRSSEDGKNPLRTVIMIPVPHYGKAFAERFGISIISSYGLTDYALATIFTPADPQEKIGSAGRCRPGMQVRIVDDDDFDMPTGSVGEILLRSDNMWGVASGYYKMPAETLACLRNLWFHTGDRGYLDEDGYLFFTDRKKDSIRRRGENVSAFEVENAILTHEQVNEAAVFAVKAEQSEDEIAACVVVATGCGLTPEELAAHCAADLASFMVPRYLLFVDELPKTQNQKIEKYKLRVHAEGNLHEYWDRLSPATVTPT
ncbi:MAG: AMP-binding protein [Burkholderiaceae bacterium]|nr:AMP-binding protein [Burkholderiaceae bacterium]